MHRFVVVPREICGLVHTASRSAVIAGLAIGSATAAIITAIDTTSGLVSAVPIIVAAVLASIDHTTARISNRNNLILAANTR